MVVVPAALRAYQAIEQSNANVKVIPFGSQTDPCACIFGCEDEAGEERAELRVFRAHLVESHVGDQLLEVDRVLRKQRHSPFPRIETDRAGDHLLDPSGVTSSRQPVRLHQSAALVE